MASGFGVLLEVDWSSLFKSFYERVRIKVLAGIPLKFPLKGYLKWTRNCV
jgi:hypothetical protein